MKLAKLYTIALCFTFTSPALAQQPLTKPAFSTFGKKNLFVEVTCQGLRNYPEGLTIRVPANGTDRDFAATFNLSEVSSLEISVSAKKAEDTLSVGLSADEQERITASTYSGLDVTLARGNANIYCELNAGEQISDE